MNRKMILLLTIVLITILIADYFLFKSGEQDVSISQENIQVVENYLLTAGEVDTKFLKNDIDNGTIIHHIYDSPKSICLLNAVEQEMTEWRIIKKQSQYYIIVYCDSNSYVYKFPESMVEILQEKTNS